MYNVLPGKQPNQNSRIALFLIFALLLFFNLHTIPANIIAWDFFGYYLYLPFTFIYHDLGVNIGGTLHHIFQQYNPSSTLYQIYESPKGLLVMKYSMGISVLNIPFFCMGHLIAVFFGFAADGFSKPYQYSILLGTIFYTFTGIYFLRKVLFEFFKEGVVILLLITVVFGTNYFFHSSLFGAGAMPHNYLFALYALLIWMTIQWHKDFKLSFAIGIGLVAGFIILCRPSEFICLVIPGFWGIYNRQSFFQKLQLIIKQRKHIVLLIFFCLLVCLPQLIYWKYFTGKFFFNSYSNNAGEGFEFFHPYIIQLLFSFRKGWYVYTPLMMIATGGFIVLYKHKREIFLSLFMFFILNLFIVGSWSNWWFAQSFGCRALIQSYPLMMIPLGFLVTSVLTKNIFIRATFFSVLFIFILINLFQTWQYVEGIISQDRMTRDYYFAVFGKTKRDTSLDTMLLINRNLEKEVIPENKNGLSEKSIQKFNFENDNVKKNICDTFSFEGNHCFLIDRTIEFGPTFRIPYKEITLGEYAWIQASVHVFLKNKLDSGKVFFTVQMEHKGWGYKDKITDLASFNPIPGQWNFISQDYLTPEVRRPTDKLQVYIWNPGKQDVFIDDMEVKAFVPLNKKF